MYIDSGQSSMRLNVAQEVMQFAVDQQIQFVEAFEQSAEEARKEKAEELRSESRPEVVVNLDGEDVDTKSEPLKVESDLGVSLDIEV